jgi:cell division protein FtsL
MRATATVFASVLTLAAAYQLYAENISTRRIEQQVHAVERQRDAIENDISVLRADRAYLARPARIEPAAKALGLKAPSRETYTSLEDLGASAPNR